MSEGGYQGIGGWCGFDFSEANNVVIEESSDERSKFCMS